jgi:hypothetical protein
MKKLLFITLLFTILSFSQKRHAGVHHTKAVSVNVDSTSVDSVKTDKPKWSKYVALNLSISNGNDYGDNSNSYEFRDAAYPSLEFGVSRDNLSLGFVLGRGNLRGLGSRKYFSGNYEQVLDETTACPYDYKNGDKIYTSDSIGNYYWEVKVVPSFPLGAVNANIIFGAGSYFNNQVGNGFIEYGSGISYSVGKITYGVCYTNWDGIDYITPNVTIGF